MRKTSKLEYLEIPFIIISLSVAITYIFGIFGYLKPGVYISGLLLILASITCFKKSKKHNFKLDIKNIRYLIFLIPFIVFWKAVDSTYIFSEWDEFSFWGPSIKLIYEYGHFYTKDSPNLGHFIIYPPIQQTFQYIALTLLGWSERTILISQQMFVLSALLFSASRLTKGNLVKTALLFVLSIVFVYSFNYSLSNIYADSLLAAYLTATLAIAITIKRKTDLAILFLAMFVLVLVKQIGLVLSLLVLFTFFSYNIAKYGVGHLKNKKFYLQIIILSIAIIVSYYSWSIYLSIYSQVENPIPKSLDYFMSSEFHSKFEATVNEFIARIFNNGYFNTGHGIINLSFITLLIACVLVFVVTSIINKKQSKEIITIGLSMVFSFALYNLFLLFCYLVFFSEYECVRLASFERYSATYSYALFFMASAILISSLPEKKIASLIYSVVIIVSILYLSPEKMFKDFQKIVPGEYNYQRRMNVERLVAELRGYMKEGDTSYFIYQNSNGFENFVYSYLQLPFKTSRDCWTIGKSYGNDDIYTCNRNISEVASGYKYLTIYKADDNFWNDNKKFLSEGSSAMESGNYKIEITDGKFYLKNITQ
ncbi:TPA: hypothetical protein LC361_002474 [Salmonella enterica subsp. enterica serovar Tamberma]|uniref:hypothetical protein n=1 Tax=Salmonella enterica TaxID=28901 RepID=UPI00126AF5E1|nr:hypothetical protein [Salmonella enterica]EAO4365390.1 hypothetical protein [Salmonella enterica subsp. enterica serovar Bere]EBF8309716.1 hypothetical protein [Salmonella enterica subsp. enterica serovar Tamberma]ECJ7062076.1 hypothetical protein [Salmonella enterica subsp. enterica]HAU6975209.1 hypothetical protein [Salmonella enterica subsp. enterica serovar Bergen]EBR5196112.1 hypothetical protein [Salmonella enterica]